MAETGRLDLIVSADIAQATSALGKVGAAAAQEMKRVERAQADAKKEGDRFIAMLEKQVGTFGKSRTEILAYEASLKGVAAQAQPLIDQLKRMEQQAQNSNAALRVTGGSAGFDESSHGAQRASGATAGFTRELLVLGHELSQGQYKRFGGSLLVLAEYSGTATKALSALVGPLGLVAAAAALLGYSAFHGHEQAEELRKSLVLTGNAAGVTAGEMDRLTKVVSMATGKTAGASRDALQALISTGEIGPAMLASAAMAVTRVASLSGETAEAVAQDFAKMSDGVAKWAAEHNKRFNFISASQYEYIKTLEESGKKAEAQGEVLRILNERLNETRTFWDKLKQAVSEAWDEMAGNGREVTVEQKLEATNKRLAEIDRLAKMRKGKPFSSAPDGPGGDTREKVEFERGNLLRDQLRGVNTALERAEDARIQKSRIAAIEARDKWRTELKGISEVNKELQKYREFTVAPLKGTAQEITPAEQAKTEDEIRRKYRSPLERKAETDAQRLKTALDEQTKAREKGIAKVNDEIDQLTKYGQVLDGSVEAQQRVELSSDRFAKATDKEKASIMAAAKEEDQRNAVKRVLTERLAEEAREQAKKAAALDAVVLKLEEQATETDAYVKGLQDETANLKLNNAQRLINIQTKRIEQDLAKNLLTPGLQDTDKDSIRAEAARRIKEVTAAIQSQDAAQREFGFGASRVFKQFQDDAANAAKFAENFIVGSMRQAEDALVNFAKTGKLNFGSLFAFMAEEYIRQTLRMSIAAILPGGKGLGSIFGAITGFFAGGPAGAATGAIAGNDSLYALPTAGVRLATGTNYVPYDGMPAVLHKGEAVVPAAYNPAAGGSGGGHSISVGAGQVIQIGQGVSRGEVSAAINAANKQSEARIQRGLRQGSFA